MWLTHKLWFLHLFSTTVVDTEQNTQKNYKATQILQKIQRHGKHSKLLQRDTKYSKQLQSHTKYSKKLQRDTKYLKQPQRGTDLKKDTLRNFSLWGLTPTVH